MKLLHLLLLAGATCAVAPVASAREPRHAAFLEFDESAPSEAAAVAPVAAGLQLASLQTAGGLQASAGLGQRGALPARGGRTDDEAWRRLFPKKAHRNPAP